MGDESTWELVHRLDLASGGVDETRAPAHGVGIVARGRFTRTGVLEYRTPGGGVRRELRHPDEVFDADSLDSLAHATVTEDHPGRPVDPDTWRQEAIGHVAGRPKRDGKFVAGEIHIQHGPAVEKAKAGKLVEFSCGYTCHYDPTPGEYEGERYDGIQRRIRYNHLATGPAGWGRAGPEVRMRLDGGMGVSGSDADDSYVRGDANADPPGERVMPMTAEEKAAYDKAIADAAAAKEREDAAKQRADKAEREANDAKTKAATLEGEKGVLEGKLSKASGDTVAREDATKREAEVQELVELRADAAEIHRGVEGWSPVGKSRETLMREGIARMSPDLKLDAIVAPLGDNKAAVSAVIASTYRIAKEHFDKVRGANDLLESVARGDKRPEDPAAGEEQTAEDAYDDMVKKRRDRFMGKKDKGSK